jgi:vesicle coat complex subunit
MPVLMEALHDPNPILRANAISALGTTPAEDGGLPEEARTAIKDALNDPDPRVREEARIVFDSLH